MTTPARRQYLDIKSRYPDALLMYQVGDFFEFFDEDARTATQALQIVLTSRAYGPDERVPLAGVPLHALETYAGRLIAQGHKVAICEQVEPPGRGLVRRAVTRVLTPGTLVEPGLVPSTRDNYLVAVAFGTGRQKGHAALAYVEASTGAFACTAWRPEIGATESADALPDSLVSELLRLHAAEMLISEPLARLTPAWLDALGQLADTISECPAHYFDTEGSYRRLCRHFETANLAPFGCDDLPLATAAAGAILAYLERMHPSVLHLLTGLSTYSTAEYVQVDARTWSALEVVEPARGSTSRATLLSTLDATRTAMGSRLLRRTLLQPLTNLQKLEARLDALEFLTSSLETRQRLGSLLDRVPDLERLSARVAQATAQPRELGALAAALLQVRRLTELRTELPPGPLAATMSLLDPCDEMVHDIEDALASPDAQDARLIRRGHNEELDALVDSIAASRRWIANLEASERERTGIKSLHVTYNKVFGYGIEVTRANLARVPIEYERRQTLVSGERFVTPQLREQEALAAQAEERIEQIERGLYHALLQRLGTLQTRLRTTAAALAQLDVWLALADVAALRGYVRPQLSSDRALHIAGGRHPVVEAGQDGGAFVCNDTHLGEAGDDLTHQPDAAQVLVLTGPNMAGKSTYLRQVALIVLLAQTGSFVPAQAARIGLVDRIFTRVGADDDLARGQSTFMREMTETAYILRHATTRSLIVLDEVGRGTSTHDGLAIARAVIEYLHDVVGARTLFATHFHELADAGETLEHVRVAAMEAHEQDGQLVFLHRLVPGQAPHSYGIQVARMAGVPDPVIARASTLLSAATGGAAPATTASRPVMASLEWPQQASTIAERAALDYQAAGMPGRLNTPHDLLRELSRLNVAGMTPLEAINMLFRLQGRAATLLDVDDA